MIIKTFSKEWARDVRELVLDVLKGEGFEYDPVKDFDLGDIKGYYMDNGGIFYLAIVGCKVVGTGAVRRVDDGICEIKRIYVRKEWRGKGIGRKLFLNALGFAEKNYSKALLKTDARLKDAIDLYLKNGFRLVKKESGTLYFEKPLS